MKKDYWFFDKGLAGAQEDVWNYIRAKKEIYSGRSQYQKIKVIDTYQFGKVLILDGVVQLSERDEFIYHEIVTQLPMFYHPKPEKVLIIGGGDGGALREVLKHPVEEVYLVDIDKKVIEVSKKYLPSISQGAFQDKRAKIIIEDGLRFVKNYRNFFDVVIDDSTDPFGPSLALFTRKFYRDIYKALKENGLMIVQAGSFAYQFPQLRKINKDLRSIFSFVKIHRACVPSFMIDELGFVLAAKKINFNKVDIRDLAKRYKKLNLKTKYYSPEIHFASAVLPQYLKEKLKLKK